MSSVPRWRHVGDDLLRRLRDGEFSDDFPGEWALAEEYGVSRGTIRRALGPLREQGIVARARGRRSHVIDTSQSPGSGPLYSLRDALTAEGGQEHSQVLTQRIVTQSAVSATLGLDPETRYVHVARVRHMDGVPVATDRIWILASVAEPVVNADLTHTSIYEVLRTQCGVELDAGVERTRAALATAETAERLGVRPGSALLLIRRRSCLRGAPVEFRETCAVGDRMSLTHVYGDASAVIECRAQGGPLDLPWEDTPTP